MSEATIEERVAALERWQAIAIQDAEDRNAREADRAASLLRMENAVKDVGATAESMRESLQEQREIAGNTMDTLEKLEPMMGLADAYKKIAPAARWAFWGIAAWAFKSLLDNVWSSIKPALWG